MYTGRFAIIVNNRFRSYSNRDTQSFRSFLAENFQFVGAIGIRIVIHKRIFSVFVFRDNTVDSVRNNQTHYSVFIDNIEITFNVVRSVRTYNFKIAVSVLRVRRKYGIRRRSHIFMIQNAQSAVNLRRLISSSREIFCSITENVKRD